MSKRVGKKTESTRNKIGPGSSKVSFADTSERFRNLVSRVPAIICELAPDGTVLFVNDSVAKITGYLPAELLGKNWGDVFYPGELHQQLDNLPVQSLERGIEGCEMTIRVKDGSSKIVSWTSSRIYRPDGVLGTIAGFGLAVTPQEQQERQPGYLATHDSLTGLPNRLSLEDSMSRVVARAQRGSKSVLLFLDLDNFETVNDALGHEAGDKALVILSRLLESRLRTGDLMARLGGDEFAVLIEGTGLVEAELIAERIRRTIQEYPLHLDGHCFHLGLSIGLAVIDGSLTPPEVLSRADTNMNRAKALGGNRIER